MITVQRVGQGETGLGVAFGLPGLVGPVAAGVRGTGLSAQVEPVGMLGMAELELGDLVPQLREGGQVGVGLA